MQKRQYKFEMSWMMILIYAGIPKNILPRCICRNEQSDGYRFKNGEFIHRWGKYPLKTYPDVKPLFNLSFYKPLKINEDLCILLF